jgi:hypothetical protein
LTICLRTAGEAYGHRYRSGQEYFKLEAFLISTGIVALAEIGDKTQLLAVILAAKFASLGPLSGTS